MNAHFQSPQFSLPGMTIAGLLAGVVVLRFAIWIFAPGI
jgi:hypothetical protein